MRYATLATVVILISDIIVGWSSAGNNQNVKTMQKISKNSVPVQINGKRISSIKLTRQNSISYVAFTRYTGEKRNLIIQCCGHRKCQNDRGARNSTKWPKRRKGFNDYNGPSSKLVKIGKTKYKFPKEEATFTEAKKYCEKENMDIASFSSPQEVGKITEYLQYIGLSDIPLFASLSSTDGVGSFLSSWGQDAPPGGAGDCLVQQKGALYNASCQQKAHFACEEKPGGANGPEPLTSLEDAVLNFVGGKNIVVPSEKASVPQAESMCANQGLELMSLDSVAQLDSVQDFLGDIGLSTSTVLTSLKKVTDGGSNWLGDLASAFLPQKDPAKDGDCVGLSSLGITGISCDTVSNFVCQAPDSGVTKAAPPALGDLFSSFLSVDKTEPVNLGGLDYILPSNKANYDEAKKLCESRQMDLLSIQTKTESDLISSFLNSKGVGSSSILTSLLPLGAGSFSWDGSAIADGLNWASNQPASTAGNCTTFASSTLKTTTCDAKSNFMCEAKPADATDSTSSDSQTASEAASEPPTYESPAIATELAEILTTTSSTASATLQMTYPTNPAETTSQTAPLVTDLVTTVLSNIQAATSSYTNPETTIVAITSTSDLATPTLTSNVGTNAAITSSNTATSTANTNTIYGSASTAAVQTTTATTALTTSTTTSKPLIAAFTYTVSKKVTYLSNETATYDEALAKCEAMGMRLLVGECMQEFQTLMSQLVADPDRKNASYFVALKKTNGNWANPGGFFNTTPANILTNSGGDCLTAQYGKWLTTPCDKKCYFACENKLNYTEVIYSKTRQYFVLRNLEACVLEANYYCKRFNGSASVVSIDTPYEHLGELNTLLINLSMSDTSVFVNKFTLDLSTWLKANKSLVEWATGHPDLSKGGCVGALQGKLISVDCGIPLPFVCEVPMAPIPTVHVTCLATNKDCPISGYPVPFDKGEQWCKDNKDTFTSFDNADFNASLILLRKSATQAALRYPDIIAFGARKINGVWKWPVSKKQVDIKVFNWKAAPTTPGDCAGFDVNRDYAVTFNCSEPRRIFCV
ncbi:uncharacterized protein LOC132197301 [Neocloeon triangulifer]|uniref:uncharacterized protein LOC132197301 n=1 Tax=Neocloeon triangulifer TaxID=2078957 RepID=UPI00286EF9E7|nr:uncharacterized protein LOC132197301 [Neocloeon triangulifer]